MTKKTKIIALTLAAAMLVSATVLCLFAFAANDSTLPEKVFVGDSVTIPDKTLSLNGESKAATVTVTMPDGGLFGGNRIVASLAGKYNVTYSATIGGQFVTEQASFVRCAVPKICLSQTSTQLRKQETLRQASSATTVCCLQ